MPHDEAVRVYHDLLSDEIAAASQAVLDELQPRRHLGFGDRPLCTVLRPRFLTHEQYRFLRRRVRVLMSAFRKAHEAAMDCQAFYALTATLTARSSPMAKYAHGACADACRDCAAACEGHQDEIMKECVKACRDCEKLCRQMAGGSR